MRFFALLTLVPAVTLALQGAGAKGVVIRQAPGSPEYNCHAACGAVIAQSRQLPSSYCTNSTFTANLASCLDCAATYNVWPSYGNSVTNGAKACNIEAVPSASRAAGAAAATPFANSTTSGGNATSAHSSTATGASASTTANRTSSATGASATSSSGSNKHSVAGVAGLVLMGLGLFY